MKERKATPEKTYTSREELLEEKRGFYKEHNIWNPAVEAVLTYGVVGTEDGRIVDAWRKHANDAYTETYFNYRFEDYYAQIACPMIILPDEDDAADAKLLDIMTRLSKLPKQCVIVHVPGAMHPFGWMLDPEPMAQACSRFLQKGRLGVNQQTRIRRVNLRPNFDALINRGSRDSSVAFLNVRNPKSTVILQQPMFYGRRSPRSRRIDEPRETKGSNMHAAVLLHSSILTAIA